MNSNYIQALINQRHKINHPGLFHGKTGIAIVLYHLARKYNNHFFEDHADFLIDEISSTLNDNVIPLDFENGLAGIGWGIEYLVQNGFLEADTDEVLEELDNRIFQMLVSSDKKFQSIGLSNGLTGFGFYCMARLKSTDQNSENNFILNRLLVEIVNNCSLLIDQKYFEVNDNSSFNLLWETPVFLYFLGELLKRNIYPKKVKKILDVLSPAICSLLPQLHTNRVFLATVIERLIPYYNNNRWRSHFELLINNMDPEVILKKEIQKSNPSLGSGTTGILMIIHHLYKNKKGNDKINIFYRLESIIESSSYWDKINNSDTENAPIQGTGLMFGLSGCLLSSAIFETEKQKEAVC